MNKLLATLVAGLIATSAFAADAPKAAAAAPAAAAPAAAAPAAAPAAAAPAAAAPAAGAGKTGEQVVTAVCAVCHATGVAGALVSVLSDLLHPNDTATPPQITANISFLNMVYSFRKMCKRGR